MQASGIKNHRGWANDWILKFWLGYAAWCCCAGWILSILGELNSVGYGIAAGITGVMGVGLRMGARSGSWGYLRTGVCWGIGVRKSFVRRFLRPLPLVYLLIVSGSIAGGLRYAPNNYDMLTYRLPRVLNWLSEGRWHWIHGYVERMNYSGCGWEWMAAPLLLLTQSTALFFWINIVSYLLLPGLIFSFLRNMGVSGRMAWAWMWMLPAGLNFVMQAGGAANDTIAVGFLLASLNFAFRARRSGRAGDIFWSVIAAGLATGNKSSNLPLALPCLVALLPALPRLKGHLLAGAGVLGVAVLSSLLPTLVLNYHFTGDWAGSPDDAAQLKIYNPVAGLVGNALQLAAGNLQPPVMPLAGKWNKLSPHLLPGSVDRFLQRDFPRFTLHMNELPQEEQSGLGLGLTVIAMISLGATVLARARTEPCRVGPVLSAFNANERAERTGATCPGSVGSQQHLDPWRGWIIASGLFALLVLMSMLGSEAIARLASPYYLFGIAAVLGGRINRQLAGARWWRGCAALVSFSVLPGLVLTPSRPLFPAVRITAALADRHPESEAIQRAALVYQVYSERAENLARLREYLPADQRVIGILGDDDTSETALWEPLGRRRVYEVTKNDNRASLWAWDVGYVVVGADGLEDQGITLEQFLARYEGAVVARERITIKAAEGPVEWYVVKLGLPRRSQVSFRGGSPGGT